MEQTEEELRALAKRRVQAKYGFLVHLCMYLVGNAGFVAIWALSGREYPWFIWVLLGWGIAVVAHGVTILIGPDTPGEQRAIERELGRLRTRHQHP